MAMGSEWSDWEAAGAHRARKASRRRRVARSGGGVLVGFLLVILNCCSMKQEPNLLGKRNEITRAR